MSVADSARGVGERRRRRPVRFKRPGPRFLVVLSAIVGGGLVLLGSELAQARQDLRAAERELLTARDAVAGAQGTAADAALDRAVARLDDARRRVGSFPVSILRPVPLLGSPLVAVDDAAGAADEVVAAGRVLARAAAAFPTSTEASVDGRDLEPFHAAAARSLSAVDQATDRLEGAERALDAPSGAVLPQVSGQAKSMAAMVRDARRELGGARRALTLLEDLSRPGTEARILVLAQDTMELRATGGFIGSFGVIRVSDGTIDLERYDSFDVLPPPSPPLRPPADLEPALPRTWGLANAGWWPDYPTSAETAKELFRRQGGGDVDGVLAVTEVALGRLVGVLGPIGVPGYPEPVVEEGFAERVLYEVEVKQPPDTPRKRFLIELSKLVFDRLFDLEAGQLGGVAETAGLAAGTGDVQLWFDDPDRQRQLEGSSWSGALPDSDGDFLMLVDSNMTASKANADLVREVSYDVRQECDDLVARVEARYRNEGAFDENLNPYYNGLLRLYVPAGSTLRTTDEGQREDGRARDGPYEVFSAEAVVEPGEEQLLTFEYRLPSSVDDEDYQLTWVRQVGTGDDVLTASVAGETATADPRTRRLELDGSFSSPGWFRDLLDR